MTDKKLISSLQGLRAVAFLCVVISHCGAPWLGPWAISVFVALSGFLMVCNYYDRPRTAPGLQSAIAFSFKKIRRLYLCPLFRAGDFTISCCAGCLYHSRKQESTLPRSAFSLLELGAVLLAGGCLFIAAKQAGVLGAVAFRYNVLFTPSAVLLVWLLAMGKGFISRLLSAKPFLWLAQLSPYGFLIHQVLIRYMEWTADKFSLTVQPVVWTLTVFLLTLCLSWFYKALERRVRQRRTKAAAQ